MTTLAPAPQAHAAPQAAPQTEAAPPAPQQQFPMAARVLERLQMPRAPEMPATYQERWELAKTFYESGLVQKTYDSIAKVFVAIHLGAELGLNPLYALQNTAVINMKPSLMSNAKLGLVRSVGLLEEFDESRCTDVEGRIWIKRRGMGKGAWHTFTIEEAKRAGLVGKQGDMYTKWPKRMLRARALAFGLDSEFGDLFAGLGTTETEEEDAVPGMANAALAGAPGAGGTVKAHRAAWTMTGERLLEIRRKTALQKVSRDVAEAIVKKATGAREVAVDPSGLPQWTEAEFGAIEVAIMTWKPAATAGGATPAADTSPAPAAAPPARTPLQQVLHMAAAAGIASKELAELVRTATGKAAVKDVTADDLPKVEVAISMNAAADGEREPGADDDIAT